jgi:uncharacterized protein (DUF362 family)
MTHDGARGGNSDSGGALIEQGVVPAVDNLLADATTAPDMVGFVATAVAETNDDSKRSREKSTRPWYKTPSVWW